MGDIKIKKSRGHYEKKQENFIWLCSIRQAKPAALINEMLLTEQKYLKAFKANDLDGEIMHLARLEHLYKTLMEIVK